VQDLHRVFEYHFDMLVLMPDRNRYFHSKSLVVFCFKLIYQKKKLFLLVEEVRISILLGNHLSMNFVFSKYLATLDQQDIE